MDRVTLPGRLCLLGLLLVAVLPAVPAAVAAPDLVGPLVGHVSPTTAKIWVYVGDRTGLRVAYRPAGTPPSAARVAKAPPYTAGPRLGEILLEGLTPATAYVYRVFFRGHSTGDAWRGRFRTPPRPGTPSRFVLATSSCMKPEFPQGSWALMQRQQPDLHLLLGDNCYADSTKRATLWRHHMAMRVVPPFAALVRTTPTYAIWDDHDFAGDNVGGEHPGKWESLDTFREVWANPAAGAPGVPGAFYRFAWGDVDFFVLDGRFHRSRLKARNDGRKRMLGDGQFRWLADGLKASSARFKVLASGSTLEREGTDTWAAYRFSRDRLFRWIATHRIEGVIWLSGDLHESHIETHPRAATGFYDLVEVISSGIANSRDLGFATLAFDTTLPDATVHVRIHHGDGSVPQERVVRASELRVP